MRAAVFSGSGPAFAPRPALPARARELIADDAPHIHAETLIERDEADRLHRERMEHERQSRLRRWQEQRG